MDTVTNSALPQVILCGENPEMRLVRPGTEEEIAIASYWNCTYTPYGVGQVLVLHVEAGVLPARADPLTLIFADNSPLGRYVADTLVQHFEGFDRLDLKAVQVENARLTQSGNPREVYRVVCRADSHTIEVTWNDLLDVRLPHTYTNLITESDTGSVLDVSNVICPVERGSVIIDGVSISGKVHSFHDGTRHRSTAFLAFSETWIRRPSTA